MLLGRAPFTAESNEQTYKNIATGEMYTDGLDSLTVEASHFISKCLDKHVENRLTLEQMEIHPWLKTTKNKPDEPRETNENI